MDLAGDSREVSLASTVKFLGLAEAKNSHGFSAQVHRICSCFLVTQSGSKCILSEGRWPLQS